MFDLGFQELIIIFIVALLVFGPKRLPEIGRSVGKAMAELKRAMQGLKETIEEEQGEIKKDLPRLDVPIRKSMDEIRESLRVPPPSQVSRPEKTTYADPAEKPDEKPETAATEKKNDDG